MTDSYTILRLTPSDCSACASLMSQAFARDPLFLHVFGDPSRDDAAARHIATFVTWLFKTSFMQRDEVWGYYDDRNRLLGAYLIEKPIRSRLQRMQSMLPVIARLIPLTLRLTGRSMGRLQAYRSITRAAAPSVPHHYLIMIGVQPEVQGKGIGRALLAHMLHQAAADPHSAGIALDTESAYNAALYRRAGFELLRETRLGELPVYCMFHATQHENPRGILPLP